MKQLIISPFAKIIEVIFLWLFSLVRNYGLSLILLSVIINVILFPFYHIADKIEKKEKNIQEKMKPKIDEFKSVYKGYEQHLYIKNVYRLNDYHPLYSLRGLVSLIIQIPFFMGAYQYLSSYTGFNNISFLMIKDLSSPDALVKLGTFSINFLPILMTAFNLISGYVYSKGTQLSEKITIIVIAIFFLIILYNSPASLLVYWTMNNLFSLIKNMIYSYVDKNEESLGGVQ